MIETRKGREILYQKLQQKDVIGKLKPILERKGFRIFADGRWRRTHSAAWETPWIHQHNDEIQECELWHDLFFPIFKQVPTYCANCWKVVVMPRTVVELFDLYELQKEMERPCKCGIELRPTDDRRYGGYFYNWGKEAGEECRDAVRKAVSKSISPKVPVILKCSCTEYEIDCGPPAEWVPDEKQKLIENYIRKYVVPSNEKFYQYDYMQAYVMLRWLHHAAMTSDLTYKTFTNGENITFKAKTYDKE
jgi:hypothetical protein